MDKTTFESIVSDISLNDAKDLRKLLSSEIKRINRQKSIHMEVYIQAKYVDAVMSAKQWAFENGLIARNTKWTFAKFCIINTTKMILNQMEKQKAEQARAENSQQVPTTYEVDNSGNQVI